MRALRPPGLPVSSSGTPQGGAALAPYKRFAHGKTLAESGFIPPGHFNLPGPPRGLPRGER